MLTTRLFEHSADAKPVSAGTTIFRVGDERDFLYAVVEGKVDIVINGRIVVFDNGHIVETVEPGGIFGEMALIGKDKRTATAVAKTDGRIVPVDERRFLFLIQQTPNFALHVMAVLAERLRQMDRRLAAAGGP